MAAKIAQACNITRQAVGLWRKVPIDRVPVVEQVTGIPRHRLRPDRPDLFPTPPKTTAKAHLSQA